MEGDKFVIDCVNFELQVLKAVGDSSGNVMAKLGDIFTPIIIDIIAQITEGNNKWTKDAIQVAGDFAHDLCQQIYETEPIEEENNDQKRSS